MQMQAERIIQKNIKQFKTAFHKKDKSAKIAKRELLGKITMATELGLLSVPDAGQYIETVFQMYEELKE